MADVKRDGVRSGSGYITVTIALGNVVLWNTSPGKKAVLKKIMWINRAAVGNGFLLIGHETNAAAFVQDLPDILMIANIDGNMTEEEIPVCGNTPDGFVLDATLAPAGCTGTIVCQSTVGLAAPGDVMVAIEVEEI